VLEYGEVCCFCSVHVSGGVICYDGDVVESWCVGEGGWEGGVEYVSC